MKRVLWINLFMLIITNVFESRAIDADKVNMGIETSMNRLQNSLQLKATWFYQPAEYDSYIDTSGISRTDIEYKWYSFRMEHNLLGYDWIVNDEYNNYKYNHSFFSNVALPSFVLLTILNIKFGEDVEKGGKIPWWSFIPFAFTNPKLEFGFMNIDFGNKFLFNSFLYYHHKLDYFAKNDNDFWRFKFGLGLGFDISKYRRHYGHFNSFTLSAGFGYDKIFDYVFDKWHTKKWVPSFCLMLSMKM